MTTPVTKQEIIEALALANELIRGMCGAPYLRGERELSRIKQHGIAQESQEAVAWMQIDINDKPTNLFFNSVPEDNYHTYIPLYTAPPPQPSIRQLIGEIDGLQKVDIDDFGVPYPSSDGDYIYSEDMRVTLDKWRCVK